MFSKNFYPTPKNIIVKMLEPFYCTERFQHNLKDKIILEPSAGKGDIVDYLRRVNGDYITDKIYCIENNFELQEILKGKRYRVIDNDFLCHVPDFNYDLIIMNPPFENGDEHLLKAFDIQKYGDIVCLLNAETIRNPYSERRKLLARIIEENGSVEFLGDCFSESERKTGVDVALVRIHREKPATEDFEFADKENIEFDDTIEENSIALRDVIGNICLQYEQVKKEFENVVKAKKRVVSLIKGIVTEYSSVYRDNNLEKEMEDQKEYVKFIQDLKIEVWKNIAEKMNIEKYMSSKVQRDFHTFITQQGDIAITKENIMNFVSIIFQTRGQTLDRAVEEVFDIFTKYYDENRVHVEGWKTNSAWKVNRKIILPYWIETWNRYNYSTEKFRVGHKEEYFDIDKVMCYIAGKDLDKITTIRSALQRKFDIIGSISKQDKYDNTSSSTFFEIKFFKKGTIHLKFHDDWLWQEFNKRAVQKKFGMVLPD